jgi:hypothetical protein
MLQRSLMLLYFASVLVLANSMQYTTLGSSKLSVSKVTLGTMTWGQQNSESEGHDQLDMVSIKNIQALHLSSVLIFK